MKRTNISSFKLPRAFASRAGSKRSYKKSKKMKDIDYKIHSERIKICREIKAANQVATFKLQLLKELSRLPTDEKILLQVNGSSILDSYYASEFKLPLPRKEQKTTIPPSVNTIAAPGRRSISKPISINCKISALDYARSIKPVHSSRKKLVCSRCFQNCLLYAIDCGNNYMLCIGCAKSNEEGRNSRKRNIAEKYRLRNIRDSETRRKRSRKK